MPFWFLTITIYTALLVFPLLQDGMFFDGITYSAIARNLAQGNGDLLTWHLHYTSTLYSSFNEHPPLVFALQALFFKVFGDHLFVERLYSFLTSLIVAYYVILIWKHVFSTENYQVEFSWLPVLLWIITPIVFWSYSNNMLENTMAVFDIMAVNTILILLKTEKQVFIRLILAGVLILCAFLCKGPTGLFPIITFLVYSLVFKSLSFRKSFIYTFELILIPFLLLSFIFILNHDAFHSFLIYLNDQLLRSVEGKREITIAHHYFILQRIFIEQLPTLIVVSIIFFIGRIKHRYSMDLYLKKSSLFFIILGLCGSLPIALSPKQAGYYLIPALPFFALSFGIIAFSPLVQLLKKINYSGIGFKFISGFSIFLFALVLSYSLIQTGKPGRDKSLLNDIYSIGKVVPENSTITICPEIFNDWGLHAYLYRYYKISLDVYQSHEYYLSGEKCKSTVIQKYEKINLDLSHYELYKQK